MSLREQYQSKVIPIFRERFRLPATAVPKVTKVVVHVGVGKILKEPKALETVEKTLARITGQKVVSTLARKSIAGFKSRKGLAIGRLVTLRGRRMEDFLEKMIAVALPRIRDFRGLDPKSFDGRGNYSLGFKEHLVFPEIRPDEVEQIHGLEVTVHTNASNDEKGRLLLESLGFPFHKS